SRLRSGSAAARSRGHGPGAHSLEHDGRSAAGPGGWGRTAVAGDLGVGQPRQARTRGLGARGLRMDRDKSPAWMTYPSMNHSAKPPESWESLIYWRFRR